MSSHVIVSRFATHLTLVGVFLTGNVLCAFAPNYGVLVVGVPVGTWVANTFGWRWAFHLVNVLTMALIMLMVMVLPRNSHIVKIGFLPQFCNSLRMRKTIRGLRCWRVGQ